MSGGGSTARVVEVFPMRLGNEILVDLTLEAEEGTTPPKPDESVRLDLPGGEVEVVVWAVPRIAHPEGSLRLNLQFRKEDLGAVEPVEGATVRWD